MADDDLSDESVGLRHYASGGDFAGITNTKIMTISDNDAPSLVISAGAATVTEGSTGTYTVKLSNIPSANVTVAVESLDTGAATVTPASLTFTTTNWNDTQTATVTGVADDDLSDKSVSLRHTASGGGYASATESSLTISDNDTASLVVSTGAATVTEGSTGTYTVKLSNKPSTAVTMDVVSLDTSVATVAPARLTFTTTNWNDTQIVTVTGVVDDDLSDESVSITHTAAGGDFAGVTKTKSVAISDNDTASLVVSLGAGIVVEGSTRTYTVKLSSMPSAAVTCYGGE